MSACEYIQRQINRAGAKLAPRKVEALVRDFRRDARQGGKEYAKRALALYLTVETDK